MDMVGPSLPGRRSPEGARVKRMQVMMELAWPDGDPRTVQDLREHLPELMTGAMTADGGVFITHYVVSAFQDVPQPPQPPDGF